MRLVLMMVAIVLVLSVQLCVADDVNEPNTPPAAEKSSSQSLTASDTNEANEPNAPAEEKSSLQSLTESDANEANEPNAPAEVKSSLQLSNCDANDVNDVNNVG